MLGCSWPWEDPGPVGRQDDLGVRHPGVKDPSAWGGGKASQGQPWSDGGGTTAALAGLLCPDSGRRNMRNSVE